MTSVTATNHRTEEEGNDMDTYMHSHAIRQENARRMATAARLHRIHADALAPETRGPSLRRRLVARLRMQPLPTLAPTPSTSVVIAA